MNPNLDAVAEIKFSDDIGIALVTDDFATFSIMHTHRGGHQLLSTFSDQWDAAQRMRETVVTCGIDPISAKFYSVGYELTIHREDDRFVVFSISHAGPVRSIDCFSTFVNAWDFVSKTVELYVDAAALDAAYARQRCTLRRERADGRFVFILPDNFAPCVERFDSLEEALAYARAHELPQIEGVKYQQ